MMLAALRLGALLIAASGGAFAQQQSIEASDALNCVTPAADRRGVPEYPFEQLKREVGATLTAEATFRGPDRAPDVEVLESSAKGDDHQVFVRAVREHLKSLRVPCLQPGQDPVRLRQTFVFAPDRREVHWFGLTDAADSGRRAMLQCVVHKSGRKTPEYPWQALRMEIQGRVLAKLRYTSADQAPVATVYARPGHAELGKAIEEWVSGLRMPCFAGEPLNTSVLYKFLMTDEPSFGMKPLLLQEVVRSVRGLKTLRFEMDTSTMACPFDLKFTFRQPLMPNAVGELGAANALRRPLLEWLAGVELDLPPASLDAIFGDTTTISVPCLKFDIKPKE